MTIVCPNCNHLNPVGATQCEACYTPLPISNSMPCPNCGATIQVDAVFCGQCGYNLDPNQEPSTEAQSQSGVGSNTTPTVVTVASTPDVTSGSSVSSSPSVGQKPVNLEKTSESSLPATAPTVAVIPDHSSVGPVVVVSSEEGTPDPAPAPIPTVISSAPLTPTPSVATPLGGATVAKTQLQQHLARLVHVQTNSTIELSPSLTVIHIGKPNDLVPPDVDVSGFPHSEVVSRSHADIRVEGDVYFIEDVGSSNGTYINNGPLPKGNRHRLRSGDRIALGKGDLVTFIFQLS